MPILAIFRSLGLAGSLSVIANLALAGLLIAAKIDARHWHKSSDRFEQLWHGEQAAHAQTVANYRAAAEQARKDDAANAERVRAEQTSINERTNNDLQARLADARARFERLRRDAQARAVESGRGATPVPGLPAAPGGTAQAAGEAGLPAPDALTATEQAIQLDELIKWVKRQAGVATNGTR